jgi:hypothetical protein
MNRHSNYRLVEERISETRDDLPTGYYRQLPKSADGPFAGYPRVFGVAWAFVAHMDSHFDPDMLLSSHSAAGVTSLFGRASDDTVCFEENRLVVPQPDREGSTGHRPR